MKTTETTLITSFVDLGLLGRPNFSSTAARSLYSALNPTQSILVFGLPDDLIAKLPLPKDLMLNKGLVFVDAATVASYFTEIWELTTQQDSAFYLVGGLHRPEWDEMVSFPTEAHLPWGSVPEVIISHQEEWLRRRGQTGIILGKYFDGTSITITYEATHGVVGQQLVNEFRQNTKLADAKPWGKVRS